MERRCVVSLFLSYVEIVQFAYHQHNFIFAVYRMKNNGVYITGVLNLDMSSCAQRLLQMNQGLGIYYSHILLNVAAELWSFAK